MTVVKETCHLASAREERVGLKPGRVSVHHLLAERGPGIRVNREDDEDLKRMEATKGGFIWVRRENEARKLDKAAAFELCVTERRC